MSTNTFTRWVDKWINHIWDQSNILYIEFYTAEIWNWYDQINIQTRCLSIIR